MYKHRSLLGYSNMQTRLRPHLKTPKASSPVAVFSAIQQHLLFSRGNEYSSQVIRSLMASFFAIFRPLEKEHVNMILPRKNDVAFPGTRAFRASEESSLRFLCLF